MTDDEVLRPTIVQELRVKGLGYAWDNKYSGSGLGHYLPVDEASFKTYHDKNGQARFQFKSGGITIAGPILAIQGEKTLLKVTRADFEKSSSQRLPEIDGLMNFKRRKELFEEFYVDNPSRQRKANKDHGKER